MIETDCSFGNMNVTGVNDGGWQFSSSEKINGEGVKEFHFFLRNERTERLPEVRLTWHMPLKDCFLRWTPFFPRNQWLLPPVWASELTSSLVYGMPLVCFLNPEGKNHVTMSFSDTLRVVKIRAGVYEEVPDLQFELILFSVPEAPVSEFTGTIRIDCRKLFYADAIRDAVRWFEKLPECHPGAIPSDACEPVFSTWYNYHQNLFAGELEQACRVAVADGMRTVIVDDGWQTDDNQRGYAFCGDWNVSANRFPDFPAHVRKIHELGMKYMLWFSVPYVGIHSKVKEMFASKTLMLDENTGAYILDPRFPDVREYLIGIYERAVREWGVDGLKLDFIDCFQFFRPDPALSDNYAGRDILSLPHAVDRLLSDAAAHLKQIRPELLIEFRQSYIGPAIRKYGNMLRACDCPGDMLANRVLTTQLRLTSGNTPVHSDMVEWDVSASPEEAARQLQNVLFSVPQISVRPETLTDGQRKMLRHYVTFWKEHRETLLNGVFMPLQPEARYPLIVSKTDEEAVIALYCADRVVRLDEKQPPVCWLVNATPSGSVWIDAGGAGGTLQIFDTCGEEMPSVPYLSGGIQSVAVPPSGYLKITQGH